MKKLVIADREFDSRFFLGTGKFNNNKVMADAIVASGTEMVTVSMKRIELEDSEDELLTHITRNKNIQLLPSSSGLYDLDLQAIKDGISAPENLRNFVDAAAEDCEVDWMIFDCPPGYTVASVGALMAADEVVIPMLLDGFSHTGMEDIQRQIDVLRRTNPCIRVAGVLLTQWHNSEVVRQGEALIRGMNVPVFRQTIRRTDKVPESTYDRQPMSVYSPTSAAARDYRAWVEELLVEEASHV